METKKPSETETPEPPPAPRSRTERILRACGCLAALLALAFAAFMGFALVANRPSEKSRRLMCNSNLKRIGMAVLTYGVEFDGRFPPDFATLRDLEYLDLEDLTEEKLLRCPSRPAAGTYLYLLRGWQGSGNYPKTANPDLPIAMERPGNHEGFINILYAGGYVETLPQPRGTTGCVETLDALHPELTRSEEGRFILANAREADARGLSSEKAP